MQTKFIAIAVSLQAPADELSTMSKGLAKGLAKGRDRLRADALKDQIETQLAEYGMPLRWAVTSVDSGEQVAYVEAVVTLL